MGRVSDLLEDQDETQLLTSHLDDAAIKEVEAVLAKHNARMIKVEHPKSNLEDLFLRTVKLSIERPGHRDVREQTPAGARPTTGTSDNGAKAGTAARGPQAKEKAES
jgi:hypothetical protein